MKNWSRSTKVRLGVLGIVLLAIGCGILAYPNGPDIKIGTFSREVKVHLGLDLQGGSALLYEADVTKVAEADRQQAIDGVRDVIERRINAFGVGEPVIQTVRSGDSWRISVELPGVTDVNEAVKRIGETPLLEFKTEGAPPEYTEEQKAQIRAANEEAKKKAEGVLQRAQTGESFENLAKEFSEDTGSKQEGGDLGESVDGAFVEPFNDVVFNKAEVGKVYPELVQTEFGYHIVRVENRVEATQQDTDESKANDTDGNATTSNDNQRKATARHILFLTQSEDPQQLGPNYEATGLTGEQLDRADVVFDPNSGLPTVSLSFDKEGTELFAKITRDHQGETVAIYLDGSVISAPTVDQEITTGQAIISGSFTVDEAKELAQRLNAGALPVPVTLISQQNVGPTLGQESIERSFFAGIIGLIVLSIFMLVYYRFPGFIALLALVVYSLMVLVVFKLWPVTLTLAGIAGFILSIGMAVDANVLIFERMKEELRHGKNIQHAIDDGFARAWLSIRDSNASSLITCLILYWFGSSLIRGFAITLAIGIIISMFSAISISRTLLVASRMNKPGLYGFGFTKHKEK